MREATGASAGAAGRDPCTFKTVASRAMTSYSAAWSKARTGLRFGAKPFFSNVSSIVL
jgi:hypothetical protein